MLTGSNPGFALPAHTGLVKSGLGLSWGSEAPSFWLGVTFPQIALPQIWEGHLPTVNSVTLPDLGIDWSPLSLFTGSF
jgi:hypothetical protein